MELGMIGLGKVDVNMAERLIKAGHRVVGFDVDPESMLQVVEVAGSLEELIAKLSPPRDHVSSASARHADIVRQLTNCLWDHGEVDVTGCPTVLVPGRD